MSSDISTVWFGWGRGEEEDPEKVGASGMGLPTLFSQQRQVIFVGLRGHASQLHSHTGPDHGKTA